MSSPELNQPPPSQPAGCWSAFVILWGLAFLLVGLLITAVSGFCGYAVLTSGGTAVRDFGGMLVGGLVVGIVLCIGGYVMMRGQNR